MQSIQIYDDNTAIVTATESVFNLRACLLSSNQHLHNIKFSGLVVFDLLVCNGLASNRFIAVDFVGGEFDDDSCRVYEPGNEVVAHQLQHFITNPHWIVASVLSSTAQSNFLNTPIKV